MQHYRNRSTVSSYPSEETTRATKEVKRDEHQNTGDTTRATNKNPSRENQNAEAQHEPPKE